MTPPGTNSARQNHESPSRSFAQSFSRDNPLLARLIEKRRLTHTASAKVTLHLAFATEGSDISYEAGDACGVVPKNDENLVAEILQRLRLNGNEKVRCGHHEETTLHDALTNRLQITRLTRKTLQEYATCGKCSKLLDILGPGQNEHLERYVFGRGLVDLVSEYPGVIEDPADLVGMLPRLSPRLYSISSSPAAHPGQIHATVAIVRYRSHDRDRGGVCSTLFADRTEISEQLPIYIHPNKKFRLPADPNAPIIMIGPGTGIAPFRGFLHERHARGHKGRNWLFFGSRGRATDFLYREELEAMQADGHLTRLDTAFSRDDDDRAYVQNRIMENSRSFWNWLEDGASVYVCGDAARMAKDVHTTLCSVVEKEAKMHAEAAREYVDTLKEHNRYHRDVY